MYKTYSDFVKDLLNSDVKVKEWYDDTAVKYPMNVTKILNEDRLLAIKLEFALAGFNKDEITVSIDGRELIIDVAKSSVDKIPDITEDVIYNKISYKSMSVKYTLTQLADIDNISVTFNNGLLSIYIPIIEKSANTKKLEIKD